MWAENRRALIHNCVAGPKLYVNHVFISSSILTSVDPKPDIFYSSIFVQKILKNKGVQLTDFVLHQPHMLG